ncbi:MAG: hypothetical protein R3B47_19450 [Bacteroidia bacterium]
MPKRGRPRICGKNQFYPGNHPYGIKKDFCAQRVIRNYYVEKGFFGTEVDLSENQDSLLKNGIINAVKRGNRIKINDIDVEGNSEFSDGKDSRPEKNKRKNPFRFWAKSKFVPKQFDLAKDALIEKYNNAGCRS